MRCGGVRCASFHQLPALAQQGPIGALVHTHNHHQMMHLMAQQGEKLNEGGADGESEPANEDDMPVFDAHEADSAEMIAKREVGRFRQVKSKTDACPLEWWRDKGSVARDRAGG